MDKVVAALMDSQGNAYNVYDNGAWYICSDGRTWRLLYPAAAEEQEAAGEIVTAVRALAATMGRGVEVKTMLDVLDTLRAAGHLSVIASAQEGQLKEAQTLLEESKVATEHWRQEVGKLHSQVARLRRGEFFSMLVSEQGLQSMRGGGWVTLKPGGEMDDAKTHRVEVRVLPASPETGGGA